MGKRLWLACLAALAFTAEAAPITFFDVQFDATAVAFAEGTADAATQSNPPDPTPVAAQAVVVGATDVSTAAAIAGPGALIATADTSASTGIAFATATSHFLGSFLSNGQVNLSIDFTSSDTSSGGGLSATSLFVLLTSGGMTLFDGFVSGPWEFSYFLADPASTSQLELLLSSDVSAGFLTAGPGDAAGLGVVLFAGTVPVPATSLLVMLGLAALVVVRQNPRRRLAVFPA